MNRREMLLLLFVFALGAIPLAEAQQAAKVYQIGILSAETASGYAKRWRHCVQVCTTSDMSKAGTLSSSSDGQRGSMIDCPAWQLNLYV